MSENISICCVGDLILDEPGPVEPYFEGCKDVLCAQDVLIGHVETPHTTPTIDDSCNWWFSCLLLIYWLYPSPFHSLSVVSLSVIGSSLSFTNIFFRILLKIILI